MNRIIIYVYELIALYTAAHCTAKIYYKDGVSRCSARYKRIMRALCERVEGGNLFANEQCASRTLIFF